MISSQLNVLTKKECIEIIHNSIPHLAPATVIEDGNDYPTLHPDRTADSYFIKSNPPIIQKIKQIVSHTTGLPIENQEPPNVVRYKPGGGYKLHLDAFAFPVIAQSPSKQRKFSSLFYLNDNFEEGGTYFPNYGLTIKPPAGTLITWSNTPLNDNNPDENSRHAGTPVTKGEKFILIIWTTAGKVVF